MINHETKTFNLKLNLLILLGVTVLNYCQYGFRESQNLLNKNQSELGLLIAQKTDQQIIDQVAKYTVGIYHKNKKGTCSGVIVSERSILTAAHCVDGSGGAVEIRFGKDIFWGFEKYQSEKIHINPKYKGSKAEKQKGLNTFDLALVYLVKNIPSSFAAIPIQKKNTPFSLGIPLIFAGYGERPNSINLMSRPLHTGIIYLSDPEFSDSEFAIYQNNGTGPCKGDSGGPAFSFHQGQLQLAGISSRGDHQCTLTVYTHFQEIKDFLNESEIQHKKNLSLLR